VGNTLREKWAIREAKTEHRGYAKTGQGVREKWASQ
jgi:hypothetical protein